MANYLRLNLRICLFISVCTYTICSSNIPIVQFNLFKSPESNGIFGNFLFTPFQINASLKVQESSSPKEGYDIRLELNEPYNQFLNGSAEFVAKSNQSLTVKSYFETSQSLSVESETVVSGQKQHLSIINKSQLRHEQSGISGIYLLTVQRQPECPTLSLSHNLTTVPKGFFDFSSNVSEKCDITDGIPSIVMDINLTLNTLLSELASIDLQQIFVHNGPDGWESMNCSNPIMDINVTAEWNGMQKRHIKKALFTSKLLPWLPSFTLEYDNIPQNPISCYFKFCQAVPN
ncbi:hypothetical protein HDE_13521 [Halotydeus destructor]|nr:hypothetical protein HDE_13521 [Halotydeus destructor]